MSGASNPATEAPAPSTVSRTVAPAVLQQLAPSVRYVDPAQSGVIMESGTKSPTVSPLFPFARALPTLQDYTVGMSALLLHPEFTEKAMSLVQLRCLSVSPQKKCFLP